MQYQRAVNVVTTDAGALAGTLGGLGPGKDVYLKSELKEGQTTDEANAAAKAIVYWSRNVARVFINRAATAFLYATSVLSFLAFLTTLSSDTADARLKRYLCALSVVINMVAVAHYKIIVKIRSFDLGAGAAENVKHLASARLPSGTRSSASASRWPSTPSATRTGWCAANSNHIHNSTHWAFPIETEDRARNRAQFQLRLCTRESPSSSSSTSSTRSRARRRHSQNGRHFVTVEGVVFCAVIMILLSVFVRVGTDEVWDF